MNPLEKPNEEKKEPSTPTPPDDSTDELKVTPIEIVESKKWSKAHKISVSLLVISAILAIV